MGIQRTKVYEHLSRLTKKIGQFNQKVNSNYSEECVCGLKKFQHNEHSYCQIFKEKEPNNSITIEEVEITDSIITTHDKIYHNSYYCRAFDRSNDLKTKNKILVNCKLCLESIEESNETKEKGF